MIALGFAQRRCGAKASLLVLIAATWPGLGPSVIWSAGSVLMPPRMGSVSSLRSR